MNPETAAAAAGGDTDGEGYNGRHEDRNNGLLVEEMEEDAAEDDCDDDDVDDEQEHADQDVQVHQLQPDQPTASSGTESRIGGWAVMKTLLVRTIFIYFVSTLFRRGTQPPPPAGTESSNASRLAAINLFDRGTAMDLYVYVTENEAFADFDRQPFWFEPNLVYGDWYAGPNGDGSFTQTATFDVSENIQNNGSLYIHVYLIKSGFSLKLSLADNSSSTTFVVHRSRRLNKFMKRHSSDTKKLLDFSTETPDKLTNETDTDVVPEVLSYWHPNLTINIVDDQSSWIEGSVPEPIDEYIEFIPETNQYCPIVYFNDYWNMNSDYAPVNSSVSELELSLTFAPLTMFRWQIYSAQRMRSKLYAFLGETLDPNDDRSQDSLKRMFLDTNPYLLGLTVVVSIVHSLFEFLAFKNDVQFWRSRTSLAGLSIRSVFFSVFQSVVTLLYIIDNDTSPIVRITVSIAVAIELWKLFKAIDFTVDLGNRWLGILPRVTVTDKASYVESQTKNYDETAFRYVAWTLLPLFGAYALYSVFYLEHRSWYSWLIGVIYGFLLTFSFVSMTPQLFINYKLKSVAHLPWRMLTYKALNTFIDDLFAFVLRTPLLFRIGCFRDDIIFLVYLYQRWIYRVDPSRLTDAFGAHSSGVDVDSVVTPLPGHKDSDSVPADSSESVANNSST